jgi:hypothetical protein
MIFKELDITDKVAGRVTSVHDGLFSGDHPGELTEFFHDELDTQLTTKYSDATDAKKNITDNWTKLQKEDFYAEIYQEETEIGGIRNQNAEQQFVVSYGNVNGYGSPLPAAFDSKSPKITKTIYSQHKNILLNPDDKKFTFTRKVDNSFIGYNSDSIYIINFSTSRMKERIDEGNFLFTLGVRQTVELMDSTDAITPHQADYKVSFQDNSVFGSSVNYITSSPQFGRVFDLVKIANSDRYNGDDVDVVRMPSTPETFLDSTAPTLVETDECVDCPGGGETTTRQGQDIRYCPTKNLSFGLVYPDLGIIILNPVAISDQLSEGLDRAVSNLENETSSTRTAEYVKEENEGAKFAWYGDENPVDGDWDASAIPSEDIGESATWENFERLKRAGGDRNYQNFKKLISALNLGGGFECRSTEIIPSKHYFIRIKNTDFNYSNNPSFVFQGYEADTEAKKSNASRDDYLGRIRHADFIIDPRVYVTTIGLYNEDNELVAVAKLSKPILKTFESEALIKVKLDF